MKRIGVHFGHLHPLRMRCIESQIKHYGDFDIWITDSNWQKPFKDMCEEYKVFKPHKKFCIDTLRGKVEVADVLRFWYASHEPDMLWCDTDLEVLDKFEAENNGKPYHGHSRNDTYDYYYFYVNGCCEFYAAGLRFAFENVERDVPILKYVHDRNYTDVMAPIRQETFRHWAFDKENTEKHWQKTKKCW
jgi:hypothetical protein